MILVEKRLIDLAAGYQLIRQAESALVRRWRGRLLAAYAHRRVEYEREKADRNRRVAEFLARARLGFWLSSASLVLGLLVFPASLLIGELGALRGSLFCFGPLLVLGGLTGWGILVVLWLWLKDRQKILPPPHPLRNGLLEPLLPKWREGLRGALPAQKPYEGAVGEYHFIARLQALDSRSYMLYRLRQQPGDDVDVVVVGPRGVWVFEVKYLSGILCWREGVWTHLKTYRGPGGAPMSEPRAVSEAFDQQWRRMAEEVAETIRRRAPALVARQPLAARVRGGLVFTHPQAIYDIPAGCPFNWGVIQFWIETLAKIPEVPGMDEGAAMEVLDALLSRHRQVSGEPPVRSMAAYARELIRQAEARLAAWSDGEDSGPPFPLSSAPLL